MKLNLKTQYNEAVFYLKSLKEKETIIEIKEIKNTRSNSQNAARWLWLSMIAEELNSRGETFTPVGTKIEVPFTKDNLYQIYWQSLRLNMYPNKKGQLNTKEFSDLVDMAEMMFAKLFNISISFPNWKDLTLEE